MANFRPIDRATPYLLPPSVEDWLPRDHLARFVVDIVDQLDLSDLTRQYRGSGSAAYHPAVATGHGARLIIANLTSTYLDDEAAVLLAADVAAVLPAMVEGLI